MKVKFLLLVLCSILFQFAAITTLHAQSKEELDQLLKSESLVVKKEKPKKGKKEKTSAEQPKEEPKPVAKTEPKKEEPKPTVKAEPAKTEPKKEEPTPAAKTEPVKTEPKKEEPTPAAKTEPVKTEPKKEEPKPAAKTEPVKTEPKKEEPKPAAKTEPVKTEPVKTEPKKEEPKPAAKTEPVKTEPKKEEPKPAAKTEPVKTEPKKEEPKPAAKTEPVKTEPKKEEPKPAAKTEPVKTDQKKEEPKPVVAAEQKQETRTADPKPEAELKSADGEKLKELPDPQSIGFRRNKKFGKQLFQRGSIYNGLKYYEAALSKKPKKTFINQPLADGNFLVRDFASANKYYKTLVDLDSVKHKNLLALYQYALTDKYLGNYEQSKANFNKFIQLANSDEKLAEYKKNASFEAQGCDLGISYRDSKDLKTYKVAHLNEAINQPYTDYSPYLKDANTLYFGSWASEKVILENKKEKYATFSRIYKSLKKGNNWGKAEEAKGEVNTVQAHTGNATFSADGNTMYYTQCLQDEMQNMRCNIYKSKWGNDGWTAGEKLDAINAEGFTTTQPSLGKNELGEDVLYFASDRNTGKGMDIFYAKVNSDGSLSKPKNIGSPINTKGNEKTPFYDFKNNMLYFSSDGHVNIGGADIFKSSLKDGQWSTPENLGMPVNSSVDDMYFMWNEEASIGFVVSNRVGGLGLKSATYSDDIYEVDLNKIYLAVTGLQTNADSANKAITNGLITLYDETSGKELKTFYATEGSYLFDLEPDRNYKITARKKGFEDMSQSTSTMGKRANDTTTINFSMKEIPGMKSLVGQRIGIVYWEFNKDNLTQSAPDTLNRVVGFMKDNPQYVLEVGSHTDSKGSDDYNMKLSKRRSDAVMKYLLSKNVYQFRLESKAYGESQPLELNENPPGTDNPEGRSKNRRTEFKITSELTPEAQQQKQEEEEAARAKKLKVKKATAVQPK